MLDAQLLVQVARFLVGGVLLFLSSSALLEINHLELFVGIIFSISLDQKTLPTQILSLVSLLVTSLLVIYAMSGTLIVFSWLIFALVGEVFLSPKRSNIMIALLCVCFSLLAIEQFIAFSLTASEQNTLSLVLLIFGLVATKKFVGTAILPVVAMLLPQVSIQGFSGYILIVAIIWAVLEVFATAAWRAQLKSAALFVAILVAPFNFWTLGALFVVLLPENKLFNQKRLDLSVSVLALLSTLTIATEIFVIVPVAIISLILLLQLSHKKDTEVAIG